MDVVQPGSARTKPIRPKAIRRADGRRRLGPPPATAVRRYPLTWARASMDARARHADFEGVQAYVMFVGYPRSGHSLVGALLDAHPDAIVAHELDALKYLQAGFGRDQLFALLLRHQRAASPPGWRRARATPMPSPPDGRAGTGSCASSATRRAGGRPNGSGRAGAARRAGPRSGCP